MAVITFGCCDMGDQDCFVCCGVRASRSLELGGFITACWLLIYTRALVAPTPTTPTTTTMPVASVRLIPQSGINSIGASNPSVYGIQYPSPVVKHWSLCNNKYKLCAVPWCVSSNTYGCFFILNAKGRLKEFHRAPQTEGKKSVLYFSQYARLKSFVLLSVPRGVSVAFFTSWLSQGSFLRERE